MQKKYNGMLQKENTGVALGEKVTPVKIPSEFLRLVEKSNNHSPSIKFYIKSLISISSVIPIHYATIRRETAILG